MTGSCAYKISDGALMLCIPLVNVVVEHVGVHEVQSLSD